ncbi:MAG: SsrA-binding protein SmpB [Actinobacteria bacterium]|jgi:SsrA-binding protein|nr:MAG: SsrA-binding protein SmpB [Actinomycetota bacterium]
MAAKTVDKRGTKPVATNRMARRDYEILEILECGLVLKGSEVKALREGKVQLNDAYARVRDGELWLSGMHIAAYSHGTGAFNHEVDRDRKLLVHRSDILHLRARVDQERLALVPLSLYFKDGRAKVELAVGKARKNYDKRQALAKRDADLETRRAVARVGRDD